MGWVASRRELSAFEMKLPIRSTHTIRATEIVVVLGLILDVESILASSSSGYLACAELGRIGASLSEVSLDDILMLLVEDVVLGPDRSGVRSVL